MNASSALRYSHANGLSVLATVGILIIAISCAQGATIAFQEGVSPTASYTGSEATFIRSDAPNSNQSGFNLNGDFIVGQVSPGDDLRGVLSFDLSTLPDNAMLDSVSLTLTSSTNNSTSTNSTFQLDLHGLTKGFGIGDVTWNFAGGGNGAWTTPGGDYTSTVLSSVSINPVTVTAGTSQLFGSSEDFVNLTQSVYEGSQTLNLLIRLADESGSDRRAFFFAGTASGTSGGSSAWRPQLSISYTIVPEPAVGTLMLLAGTIGVCLRRRYRA